MASVKVNWYRDPSKDILSNSTLYTDTTSPVVGTILYNNLGEDSGIKVGTVNSEDSFTVESEVETYTLTINCTTSVNQSPTNFVVTEVETGTVLYTASNLPYPSTVTIDFPKTSTIKITNLVIGVAVVDGCGCWGLSVTNCSETHDSISSDGKSSPGYYNNIVLSNFTGNPTVNLDFGYGPV